MKIFVPIITHDGFGFMLYETWLICYKWPQVKHEYYRRNYQPVRRAFCYHRA